MTVPAFRKVVWAYYEEHGRHSLPWRKTHDPYKVLVSESMLQQTQVERVIPYFKAWMKKYPNVQTLAAAPLADVLISWQGLGYNRRAKMLHEAAKKVVNEHNGKMPKSVELLETLPGVGHYTARAVAAFAYNQDVVFIETNIRTAIVHHFFADQTGISDTEVFKVLQKVFPKADTNNGTKRGSRDWYAALMDYGAHLKRSGVRINAKSKGYTKQSTFTGSAREVRGAILRTLAAKPVSKAILIKLFSKERTEQVETQLTKLTAEGLIIKEGRLFSLPR
jgi:A/G-specific adenine glycosylase